MFEKGSYVTYRSEGVCVIVDIRKENFGAFDTEEDYYILAPVSDMKSTLFVPVNTERLVGFMRALLCADELNGIISELRNTRMDWIVENRARSTALKQIVSVGERRELIVLLNTLYDKMDEMKKEGRRPGTSDMGILAKAERLIYEELSVTTDIPSQERVKALLRGEYTLGPRKE